MKSEARAMRTATNAFASPDGPAAGDGKEEPPRREDVYSHELDLAVTLGLSVVAMGAAGLLADQGFDKIVCALPILAAGAIAAGLRWLGRSPEP